MLSKNIYVSGHINEQIFYMYKEVRIFISILHSDCCGSFPSQGLVPMHGCLLFFRHCLAGLHFQNSHLPHSPQIPCSIRMYIETFVLAKDITTIYNWSKSSFFQYTLPRLWISRFMSSENVCDFWLLSFETSAWRRPVNIYHK